MATPGQVGLAAHVAMPDAASKSFAPQRAGGLGEAGQLVAALGGPLRHLLRRNGPEAGAQRGLRRGLQLRAEQDLKDEVATGRLRAGAAQRIAQRLVERGIDHLNKLVVDVTQFSRRRKLEASEVDLHELIDSSIELVADRVRDKQTPIEKNYAAQDIRGTWDPEQLRAVFVNMLANAIDASELKSRVEISTELIDAASGPKTLEVIAAARTRRVRIAITDHGAGMDAKTQARLFEPFFTTKKRGTGLGLSIVRQILDLHGGNIEVESKPGKGTTFRIELPIEAP